MIRKVLLVESEDLGAQIVAVAAAEQQVPGQGERVGRLGLLFQAYQPGPTQRRRPLGFSALAEGGQS